LGHDEATVTELRVSTWNCFGMGQGAFDAVTAWRAPFRARLRHPEVAQAFEGAHVTCLQEILSRDAESFFDALPGQRVRDRNHVELSPVTLRGSGLGVVGRGHMRAPRLERFGGRQVGWDRFARKGTLHTRLEVDGMEVDLMNVHLQAGYDAACTAVRGEQLDELGRRVAALIHEDRTFLVCGDFNVCGLDGGKEEYSRLRAALPGFVDVGEQGNLPTFDPHEERNALAHATEPGGPQQRVDYIFVHGRRGGFAKLHSVERILDRPLAERSGSSAFASDHFGLSAHFELG